MAYVSPSSRRYPTRVITKPSIAYSVKTYLNRKTHVGAQVEIHVNRKDVMETSFRAIMGIKDAEALKTR